MSPKHNSCISPNLLEQVDVGSPLPVAQAHTLATLLTDRFHDPYLMHGGVLLGLPPRYHQNLPLLSSTATGLV